MSTPTLSHLAPETLCLYTDPAYRSPAPEEVRVVIQILGLTGDQVAGLVGVKDGRAVRRWMAPLSSKTYAQIDYATWQLLLLEAGLVRLRKRRIQVDKSLSSAKALRSSRSTMEPDPASKKSSLAVPG